MYTSPNLRQISFTLVFKNQKLETERQLKKEICSQHGLISSFSLTMPLANFLLVSCFFIHILQLPQNHFCLISSISNQNAFLCRTSVSQLPYFTIQRLHALSLSLSLLCRTLDKMRLPILNQTNLGSTLSRYPVGQLCGQRRVGNRPRLDFLILGHQKIANQPAEDDASPQVEMRVVAWGEVVFMCGLKSSHFCQHALPSRIPLPLPKRKKVKGNETIFENGYVGVVAGWGGGL